MLGVRSSDPSILSLIACFLSLGPWGINPSGKHQVQVTGVLASASRDLLTGRMGEGTYDWADDAVRLPPKDCV